MAIKVVQQGQIPAERPYAGTCSVCNTKIECVQADGQIVTSPDQRESNYLRVSCPTCQYDISCYPMRSKPPLPQNK